MFEKLLFDLHIKQKNGLPGHPTTQGKVERFQATMKKWLAATPPATTIEELNQHLDEFRTIYNQFRPHRSLHRHTPNATYQALPKAEPIIEENGQQWRIRHDKVGSTGAITYRYAGTLKHLAVGREHKGQTIIILATGPNTTIINQHTGEIIAEHTINPDKDYQPKTRHKSER